MILRFAVHIQYMVAHLTRRGVRLPCRSAAELLELLKVDMSSSTMSFDAYYSVSFLGTPLSL
jgi:hypothetical protein